MIVLGIETSSMLGGLALLGEAEGLIAEARLNVRTTHSERLMKELDGMLQMAGIGLDAVGALAVSIGPGSFTGLRIGLATAKGIAFATGKPIVSVPTLEAFAMNLPHSAHPVCPMLDARKGEVYAGLFQNSGGKTLRLMPEGPVNAGKMASMLTEHERIVFIGEGALLYKDAITSALGEKALFGPPNLMVPMPSNVALLGLKKALAGDFEDPLTLSPLYIRKSEAESKTK